MDHRTIQISNETRGGLLLGEGAEFDVEKKGNDFSGSHCGFHRKSNRMLRDGTVGLAGWRN